MSAALKSKKKKKSSCHAAPIQTLAWELPCVAGVARKQEKETPQSYVRDRPEEPVSELSPRRTDAVLAGDRPAQEPSVSALPSHNQSLLSAKPPPFRFP